jgi:hypothetical protein
MYNKLTSLLATALLICTTATLTAQNVGIGTTSPNASAALDVQSTTQGMLVPRMTSAQRTAIAGGNPPAGLLVYQTDGTAGFYFYNGSAWAAVSASTGVKFGTPATITNGGATPISVDFSASTTNSLFFINRNGTSGAYTINLTLPNSDNYAVGQTVMVVLANGGNGAATFSLQMANCTALHTFTGTSSVNISATPTTLSGTSVSFLRLVKVDTNSWVRIQ